MASKSLGVLTLDVVARIGGYTAGLDKAEKEAKKRAAAIEKAFDTAAVGAGIAFGAMAVAATTAFAAINRGIDEAAKFQDLSETTGAAAEDIAGLAVAAATAGVQIEEVAGATVKLTKNLATGSKETEEALKNLGITIADFKKLDPVAQYEAVSKALAGFADGASKTANAIAIFGKSGADQLKVMKALEEQGGRTNILTKEQIALADEYGDKLAKSRAELGLHVSALSTQFIPAMTATQNAVKDVIGQLLGLQGGFKDANTAQTQFATNLAILDWAENVAVGLATVGESIAGLARLVPTVAGSFKAVAADVQFAGTTALAAVTGRLNTVPVLLEERNRKVQEANQAYVDLWKSDGTKASTAIKKSFEDQRKTLKNLQDPEIQRLLKRSQDSKTPLATLRGITAPPTKSGGGSDDPTKKLLDNELKAIKAQGDAAKDLLADRNRVLDLYNQQGLLSVQDYYNGLKSAQDEAFAAQRASLDAQIAALQAYQAKAGKATDRADAQGKINDLLVQQAKLERESGMAALEMGVKQQQAMKAYRDSLDEVNAKILEMDGNLGAAAEIRFDKQNEQLRKLAEASGDFASVKQIDRLKAYTVAQANINSLQQKFSLAQGDLAIAEERISQARERGTMGEIESLNASGVARQQAIAVMQKQLDMYQALDKASLTDEQIQQIERLKVQLEGLKATADPLADRFNTLFSDAAGDALGDYLTGVKSAKEATKDFLNSVTNQITKMVAQDLGKKLFSSVMGGDSGGGVGGFLSSIFGGSSSKGGADAIGGLISKYGFASGGYTGHGAANDPAGIVHKGEYVLDAETTRRLGVQNLDRGNFGGQTVNFAIQGKMDLRTQEQIAQRTRQAQLQTASRFRG